MFKAIQQKVRKQLKEKKGSMLIEYVLGLLMLTVFVGFCLDVVFVGHKHYYVGEEMAHISRVLAIQSGVEQYTPTGFPGGSQSYQTSKEIIDRMEKVANAAGFERDQWDLYYTETNGQGIVVRKGVLSEDTTFQADYLDKISIEFKGKYRWNVLSTVVPGMDTDRTLTIKRISMAEYLRNYD